LSSGIHNQMKFQVWADVSYFSHYSHWNSIFWLVHLSPT